jgi:hypothetical protein
MKKYIIVILCYFLTFYDINSFAQNLDSLQKAEFKAFKKTLWLGTNITMPLWALSTGGYGFEVNSLYFIAKDLGFNFGVGITNYRNMGVIRSANYSSLGQHVRAGILLGMSDFSHETFRARTVFGFSLVYANTHETGYWNTSPNSYGTSSSGNIDYWGGGYNFDEWRQVYGIEFSTLFLFKVLQGHLINFKPFLTICDYDNKSYFPVSSASGFGYLPFSGKNSGGFTMGMQLWYYVKL